MLLLSALGGCIGGLIAFLTARARWWRIIIGLVTGFVLYWAFLVGVFHTLARGFVLNPLSTIALSILGGWLGTAAFTRILHLLGVPDA